MTDTRVWIKLENSHSSVSVHVAANALIDDLIDAALKKERRTGISPGNVTASIDEKGLGKSLPVSEVNPTPTENKPILLSLHNEGVYACECGMGAGS